MVVAILSVLIGLALAVVSLLRRSAQSTRCLYNLRAISHAITQYAVDYSGIYPVIADGTVITGTWEHLLSDNDYIGDNPEIFRCPADVYAYSAGVPSSYDWRDTGDPATTMAGKALTNTTRSNFVLAFEALPRMHNKTKMNVAMVDGSAQVMDYNEALGDLFKPIRDAATTASSGGSGGVLN